MVLQFRPCLALRIPLLQGEAFQTFEAKLTMCIIQWRGGNAFANRFDTGEFVSEQPRDEVEVFLTASKKLGDCEIMNFEAAALRCAQAVVFA